jgi:hypothetical protein
MRVIICGSRNWEGITARARIHNILGDLWAFARALGQPLTIIHGDCPTGVDAIADAWARRRSDEGIQVRAWPAEWDRLGKAAGPVRNSNMALAGADMCIAFLRDDSRGTKDMIYKAQARYIPTFVINWDPEEPDDDEPDDETPEQVLAAFNRGVKRVTSPPLAA